MSMDEGTKREYVNALVREIELSKEKMEGRVVTSVFIGGGTPSILQENFITKIMEAVKITVSYLMMPRLLLSVTPEL